MSVPASRLVIGGLPSRQRSVKVFRPAQLRKLKDCEQVAAVCYRAGNQGIEFLLVQTRGGRWTFPKGGAEPGLTHAQAAALEAMEEAGVHGRMEEASFTRYVRRGRARLGRKELAIEAYLCEVLRVEAPQEDGRNPTWFSAGKAKRRLREDRSAYDAEEMARVVDRAVRRIRKLHSAAAVAHEVLAHQPPRDALQRVQFEAFEAAGVHPGMAAALLARSTTVELAVNAQLCDVLPFSAGKARRTLGAADTSSQS